ncbi:Methyltransferase domain-containing protein [Salinibacterium sp. NYA9b]
MREFDKSYWEDHWSPALTGEDQRLPVNPYLSAEITHLPVGTAFDAGCGAGAETLWLAERGWAVTAADISATALITAQKRAAAAGLDDRIEWLEADLARWEPEQTWNLVVTSYAHADIGQLAFYERIASWVASGGTLLIVGHRHGHEQPDDATVTLTGITSLFARPHWRIETNYENTRTVHLGDHPVQLRDVIVRAHRLT